ncbi:hypothetical protein BP6252_08440 [Coleophoma cylindrospora]|uniref:WD40 repeat-like protein n=1 Tax=Coleophoma cylindrospora TaxID=1849047 RepID=A0A3D8R648_9HELO|nr:hypothetical protein BP6252_08440 [Coleophoma cylindrospora]
MSDITTRNPSLVASTGNTYCCSIAEARLREQEKTHDGDVSGGSTVTEGIEDVETDYFKSAQWTADGTTLLTSSADNTVRTFILPPTLLDDPTSPIDLTPYTSHVLPTPTACLSPYPHFSLSDTSTTLYLSAPSSLPIRLQNVLTPTPGGIPVASYNFISPTTEAYYPISSLLWSSAGTHFMVGTDCLIGCFDVSRSGEGPMTSLPTIPSKRHKMKGGGVGMRGIISALSLQPATDVNGMLAAGTWTRWVSLYDAGGMGGTVASWSIADAADKDSGIGGLGVTQTAWSSCGKYLCVAERMSRGVMVYDIRVAGKMVCWLEGREAMTNQRLGIDLFEGGEETGLEIWAGGTDGVVRVWEGVGRSEGAGKPSWEWRAHDDPISSATVHSSGSVVATSSGQRIPLDYEDSESESESSESDSESTNGSTRTSSAASSQRSHARKPDNSIKVWCL